MKATLFSSLALILYVSSVCMLGGRSLASESQGTQDTNAHVLRDMIMRNNPDKANYVLGSIDDHDNVTWVSVQKIGSITIPYSLDR